MSTELATAYITLIPSARGMGRNITNEIKGAGTEGSRHLENSLVRAGRSGGGRLKNAISGAFKGGAIAGAAAIGTAAVAFKSVVDSASNLSEAQSKVDSIFGPQGLAAVQNWSKGAAVAFGQSEAQATSAIGTYGNLLTSFGLSGDAALGMSTTLTGLASDLASFNNTSVDDALQALQSGLTGETEPLKRYGVALDDASLKAKALAMGIADGKATLTPAQKAQAAYALIMERTTNAQGDFARTSDGLANRQRILGARFENLKTKIGAGLLPIATKLAEVFADRVMPALEEAGGAVRAMFMGFQSPGEGITSSGFAGRLEAIGIAARSAFEGVQQWWKENGPAIVRQAGEVFDRLSTFVGNLVGFVRENWPQIKATIAAEIQATRAVVESVVNIIQTIWRNWGDDIMGVVRKVFPPMLERIQAAWGMIAGIFETAAAALRGDWGEAWEAIKKVLSNAWTFITSSFEIAKVLFDTAMQGLVNLLKTAWSTGWDKIKELAAWALQWVVDEIGKTPERIALAASGMWDGIKDAFKAALNWIIRTWNDLSFTLPSAEVFGQKVGGWTLDTPDLEEFHTGGVVPGPPGAEVPIMALAGERVLSPSETRAYDSGRGRRRGRIGQVRDVHQHIYSASASAVNRDLLWETV